MDDHSHDEIAALIASALEAKQKTINILAESIGFVRDCQAKYESALAEWDSRYEDAINAGWSLKELDRLGLVPPSKKGKRRRSTRRKKTPLQEPIIQQDQVDQPSDER